MFSRHPEALRAMATWLVEQETEEVVMRYEERGPEVNKKSKQARAQKMIRELRRLGYRVEPTTPSQLWQPRRAIFDPADDSGVN